MANQFPIELYCRRTSHERVVFTSIRFDSERNITDRRNTMADQDFSKLRVVDLKRELRIRGLKVSGNKKDLIERLQTVPNLKINKPNHQNKPCAKRRKLNHKKVEQSTNILKMPIEIIEYIFDFLSLKDLSTVSATCKQMQQLAGRIFQQNYSGVCPTFCGSVMGDWTTRRDDYNEFVDFEYLIPFVDKIKLTHAEQLKYFNSRSQFHQLKYLGISWVDFDSVEIDRMAGALNQIEYLALRCCRINENTLENLLTIIPNLKRLCLWDNTGVKKFERNFPTLEHYQFNSAHSKLVTIGKFLTLNPNVRKLTTSEENLWLNRKKLKATKIKLEELNIECSRTTEGRNAWKNVHSFLELLNSYGQHGLYQRLNVYYNSMFDQDFLNQITNSTSINCLWFGSRYCSYIALSCLINVKEISFPDSRYITDIETLATLDNLKFIHFGTTNMSHLKLFVGGNSKLKHFQIDWLIDDAKNVEEDKVLNLTELNRERAKLQNAEKTTLFVQERVYLATRRANQDINLDLIRLKRSDFLHHKEFDFYPRKIYGCRVYRGPILSRYTCENQIQLQKT